MDAETAKALAPVIAAFIGGLVGGFSAFLVAVANIRGQRETARDQALREWRAAPIRALLDLVLKRAVLYQLLGTAKARHQHAQKDGEADPEGAKRVADLVEQLAATPDIGIYASAAVTVPGTAMETAVRMLYEAESESHALLVTSLVNLADPNGQALVLHTGARLSESMVAVQQAAEAYVFERATARRSLLQRLLRRHSPST